MAHPSRTELDLRRTGRPVHLAFNADAAAIAIALTLAALIRLNIIHHIGW